MVNLGSLDSYGVYMIVKPLVSMSNFRRNAFHCCIVTSRLRKAAKSADALVEGLCSTLRATLRSPYAIQTFGWCGVACRVRGLDVK
jgi:hypothetical protein